jgi:hypothetical protein
LQSGAGGTAHNVLAQQKSPGIGDRHHLAQQGSRQYNSMYIELISWSVTIVTMFDIKQPLTNMEWIYLPVTQIEISTYPVFHSDFHQNGNPGISSHASATPITNVSASEASAFAEEMGARLPEYAEIIELLDVLKRGGENFPYLSTSIEWLNCSPDWNAESQKMNCIASIDTGSMRVGLKGSIQDGRYPFVTFRIARPR